jgi:hypothetical protein
MKNFKRLFNLALESSLSATLTLEAEYDAACYRSPETRQALRHFIESRKKEMSATRATAFQCRCGFRTGVRDGALPAPLWCEAVFR